MAENNAAKTVAMSSQAPPQPEFSKPLTIAPDHDDSDEWEYEYSTTETETYYVTLDLSGNVPTKPPTVKRHGGRGAYHQSRWKNPGLSRHKRQLGRVTAPVTESATFSGTKGSKTPGTGQDANGKGTQDASESDDDGDKLGAKSGSGSGTSGQELVTEKASEIQILDLHSENPLISYGGQAYSCEWAENIGTELLFTMHDNDKQLPILRALPNGVDLLGASSARILSTAVDITPKSDQPEAAPSDRWTSKEHNRFVPGLSIPVSMAASDKRKSQARFLEALMNIKQAKGEVDKVTINLQKRQTNAGWKRHIQEQRNEERMNLRKVIERGGRAAEEARKRLEYMDQQDLQSKASSKGKRGPKRKTTEGDNAEPGKRVIRRRPRGGMPLALYQRQENAATATPDLGDNDAYMAGGGLDDSVSTPTPNKWADLEEDIYEDDDS